MALPAETCVVGMIDSERAVSGADRRAESCDGHPARRQLGVADLHGQRGDHDSSAAAISSVSPSPVATGNFTLTVNGVGFTAGSVVSFDGLALADHFRLGLAAACERHRAVRETIGRDLRDHA